MMIMLCREEQAVQDFPAVEGRIDGVKWKVEDADLKSRLEKFKTRARTKSDSNICCMTPKS